MRIIHTADWHLCTKLDRVDRTNDLKARVEAVAGLCDEHRADVLAVAGDLFCDAASVDDMAAALDHLHATFRDFFDRGGTILAVTGNHDREARVGLVRQGMRLAAPAGGKQFRPGRMYLLSQPLVAALEARPGDAAQFVLLPYPTATRYGLPDDRFVSTAEQNRALNARVCGWLADARAEVEAKLPTVLVGHLHVAGAGLSHALYRITEADDVVFDHGFRPNWVHYAALGHIHKPQALGGLPTVRYSGSLDRLDFGERDDDKGVVLVEVGPAGVVGEPTWLPIAPTPMHRVELAGTAGELDGLAGMVPDGDRWTALVRVVTTLVPGGPTRDEVVRAVRSTFPRYTEVTWARPDGGPAAEGSPEVLRPAADHRATVREYLARKLGGDPDRDAVMRLADEFLAEDGR